MGAAEDASLLECYTTTMEQVVRKVWKFWSAFFLKNEHIIILHDIGHFLPRVTE
jgi:hypothetical protein